MSAVHHSGSPPREPESANRAQAGIWPLEPHPEAGPIVGRVQEIDRIVLRLLAAKGQRGGIAAVTGEPGIGKTRLLQEIADLARNDQFLVVNARMLEWDWQPSYQAWVDILQQAITGASWPTATDDPPEWARTLLPIAPALALTYPGLAPPGHLTALEEQYRLADAITRCLHDLSKRRPLLIVLDDIQWSDAESLRVLHYFAALSRPAAVLILIGYRDDYGNSSRPLADILGQLRREARFEEIKLRGLATGEVELLVRSLSVTPVPDQVVTLIETATRGNPFFIEEITRRLVEEIQPGEPTSQPLTFFDHDLSIPESLRQVVEHRLGRLSQPTQRMLRLAAVCTDGFDFPVLQALTSLSEDDLLDAIDEALAARLLAPTGGGEERYDFQHALVRRTLYDGWSPSRRIRLHRTLATSLEQIHRDAHHLYAPALAAHYHISASLPGAEQGVPHALNAAEHARRRFAPEQAATYLRMARDLAIMLPAAERAKISVDLTVAEADALWLDAALSTANEALLLLEEAGATDIEKARFLATAATGLHDGGQAAELWMPLLYRGLALTPPEDEVTWARLTLLIERFEPVSVGIVNGSRWLGSNPRAIEIARASGDEDLFARSLQPWDLWDREWTEQLSDLIATWRQPSAIIRALTVCGADWLYHHGEFRRARAHFEILLRVSEGQGSVPGQAEALVRLGIIHTVLGDLDKARTYERRATTLADRLGRGHRLHASLQWSRALLREVDSGPWDDIAEYFVEFVSNPTVGRRTVAFDDAALGALALVKSGKPERARALLAPLVRLLDTLEPTLWLLNGTVGYAAAAAWALAARDFAPDIYRSAIAIIDAGHGDFPGSSLFLSAARMAVLMDLPEESGIWFAKARGHLDLSGQRPLRAVVDFDESTVLSEGSFGDRDRASMLARSAHSQFLELGMTGWADRTSNLSAALAERQQNPRSVPGGLTQRELDVVRRVARGFSDRQIGDDIFVSPRTVYAHVRNILAKTHLKNRTEISIWAVENGVIRQDRAS